MSRAEEVDAIAAHVAARGVVRLPPVTDRAARALELWAADVDRRRYGEGLRRVIDRAHRRKRAERRR